MTQEELKKQLEEIIENWKKSNEDEYSEPEETIANILTSILGEIKSNSWYDGSSKEKAKSLGAIDAGVGDVVYDQNGKYYVIEGFYYEEIELRCLDTGQVVTRDK